jgi:serine/threonine-protein kinase RsbW
MLGGQMAEATAEYRAPDRQGRSVELRVAAQLENLAVLRTLVAAVAVFEDLDFDAVADLRLAVDEACTTLIRAAVPDSMLVVTIDPRDDAVVITASTACQDGDVIAPGGFSWHVLSSLADEVHAFSDGTPDGQWPDGGGQFGISLITRRVGLLR